MTNLFVERLLGPKSKSLKSSKASPKPEPANASAQDNFSETESKASEGAAPVSNSVAAVQAKLAQSKTMGPGPADDGMASSVSARDFGTSGDAQPEIQSPENKVVHEPMDFSAASQRFEGFSNKGSDDDGDDADDLATPDSVDAKAGAIAKDEPVSGATAEATGSSVVDNQAKQAVGDTTATKAAGSKPARVPAKPSVTEQRQDAKADAEKSEPKAVSEKRDTTKDSAQGKGAAAASGIKKATKPAKAESEEQPQEVSTEAKAETPMAKSTTSKAAKASDSDTSKASGKDTDKAASAKKPDAKAAKADTKAKPAAESKPASNVTPLKPDQAKKSDDAAAAKAGGNAVPAATGPKPARRPSKAAALIAAKKAEMAKSGDAGSGAVRRPDAAMVAPKPEKAKKNPEDLTSEDITLMIEEAGALLTGPGGAYERRPEQRELMALFENGLFLVSRSHIDDPHVLSFAGLLRRKGMTIDMIPVEIAILSKCYEVSSGGDDQVVKADDEATSMQREIVRFIAECARLKASDAHVVVSHGSAIVRLRIDGVLKDFMEWRSAYGSDFCAAAFAMADASDASYQPYEYQAARISDTSVRLPGGVQALRLQFNPLSYGGRHMVARFLYRTQGVVGDVDTLGYAEKQITQIKRMRAVPMGINIVAGPTGSGKSTTLQRILSTLMQERRNEIATFTVEDPPEYVIEGAQQMPVTNASTAEERKEKFNAAIRAALRSDPDVIMIGEIRDSESAKLAFEAAMTGHQVWATLHAVDALTIVSRLKDIGVDEFKLYDPAVFTGLVGQRLTRALCDDCKIPIMQARDEGMVDDELWERTLSVYSRDVEGIYVEGKGCPKCNGTGVVGRSVVAEVLLPDDAFMEHMKNDDKLSARRHWVESLNGITMMGHGILKAKTGVCSTYEIERMLGPLELDRDRVRKVAAE